VGVGSTRHGKQEKKCWEPSGRCDCKVTSVVSDVLNRVSCRTSNVRVLKYSTVSMFVNLDIRDFDLSWSSILVRFVYPSWLILKNRDDTTLLDSQLCPLSCYCADHSQLNHLNLLLTEVHCCRASWTETLSFYRVMYFVFSKSVCILLKVNTHAIRAFTVCFICYCAVTMQAVLPHNSVTN
jgi:hypothetical protein